MASWSGAVRKARRGGSRRLPMRFTALRPPIFRKALPLPTWLPEHYEDMLSFYGPALGLRCARKHLGWYLDTAQTGAGARHAILTADDPAIVLRLIRAVLSDAPPIEKDQIAA